MPQRRRRNLRIALEQLLAWFGLWVISSDESASSPNNPAPKRRDEPGMCILDALALPATERDDITRLAATSGLSSDAIHEMDKPVSTEDVAGAPLEIRQALEVARQHGQLRCGFIRTRALDHEETEADFAATAPFVVGYSGVVAAAELIKE